MLDGKVAVVTGGARGIGLATARALVRNGMRVAIGDVDTATLDEAAPAVGARFHGRLDVTDPADFRAFVDRAEAALGKVDVMVNNAGIMPTGRLVDEPDDVTRRMLEINTFGVVTGTKRALESMLPRGSGHVVNIASMAGVFYMAGVATYTASKWAVLGFTDSARYEYAGSGVSFTAILPGVVHTDLSAGAKESRMLRSVEPDDIAAAVVRTLERPKARAYVPRSGGPAAGAFRVLPRKVSDRMLTAAGGRDAFLSGIDHEARAAYEARARRS